MNMEHSEYLELQGQLQDHFDGRYRQIEDCEETVKTENDKIERLRNSITELKVEQAKTNTRLAVLIGILCAIAVPLVSLCVKLLFGS